MGMGDCMVEWVGVTWDEESDIGKTQRGRRVGVGLFLGETCVMGPAGLRR